MAGEIEEPLRFNFQADLLQSGSISFGRFESESLSWERRSSFSHNRYLEEVEKYSKPGSVTEKKAYFEAHFRRKALLKQGSSESQDEREFLTTENDGLHDLQESESGNDSKRFTSFDESPHSSGHFSYNKETEIEICVNENVGTHQTETSNVNLVESEEITEVTVHDLVVTVDVASEIEQPKPKPKAQTNVAHVSRIISTEASNATTSKTKIREIKGSPKVKKSTRPASAISNSGRKTLKSEEPSTSFMKAKLPPPNKSIVKEYRPEKSLQRARETVNRTKPTITTPSKSNANQIATGINFKSDQRSERRKEDKKAAAETTQSRKNLNFKATPMPSFYKESVRSLDQNKVTPSSKIPNRPRTASMAPTTKKVPTNSASSSNPRPVSSTSLTNRSRLLEPSRKVQDKKKDLNLSKQKHHEASIGGRVRELKGVHTGPGLKPGHLAVRVAT